MQPGVLGGILEQKKDTNRKTRELQVKSEV